MSNTPDAPTPPHTPKSRDINDHVREGGSIDDLLLAAELVQLSTEDIQAEMAGEQEEGTMVVFDYLPDDDIHMTDLGNARLLVQAVGRDFRWCGAMPGGTDDAKGWLRWTGTKWISDETNAIVRDAMTVAVTWRERAAEVEAAIPPKNSDLVKSKEEQTQNEEADRLAAIAKAMKKHANRCESAGAISAMIRLARSSSEVVRRQSDFDKDPWLFTAQNLTHNLKTGDAYPPRREDHITRTGGHGIEEDKPDCPVWLRFIETITGGDADLAQFLQRAAGYSLTGVTTEQCIFIAYGSGQNGKSTFLAVMRDLLGDYFASARVETFLDRDRSNIPNDLAALAGVRMVVVNEPEEGVPLAEGIVKVATGGDPIRARFLQREFFEYLPNFKLWIPTNHKPIIRGTDKGIWRRIRLVPFTVTIPDDQRDDNLMDKLRAEYAGIFQWLLDGAEAWRKEGLRPPEAVLKATAEYKAEMDVLAEFLEEKCTQGEKDVVDNSDIYSAYTDWARRNGHHPKSQRSFSIDLKARGFKQDPDRSKGRRWLKLALKLPPVSEFYGQRPAEA